MTSDSKTRSHAVRFAWRWCAWIALIAIAVPQRSHAQLATRFNHGIVVGSDWLQANALPLRRDAAHSGSIDISLRRGTWTLDGGALRIARNLSTVRGGFLSGGVLLHWYDLQFIPRISAFAGQAQASRDSTGYDFSSGGTTGHVPRYSYSSGASFGGGASFTIEAPIYRMIGVRAVVQQWYFSGAPLAGDRARTTLGAGVSLRLGR